MGKRDISGPAADRPTRRVRGGAWFAAAAVLALSILAYLPGLPGNFVYDDHRLIVENDGLKRPFDPARSFLRDYYASDLDRMGLGYYRPVAALANEFDYRRGGGGPGAFHATNIVLHSVTSLLVFLLGLELFGRRVLPSGAAALLFALHPSHAESVAFISGRVDPLAAAFSLGTILAHLIANRARVAGSWRVLAGGAWFLALLSKEMAVTVPVLILVLESAREGWPSRRTFVHHARRYLPFVVVAGAYLVLRVLALGTLVAPSSAGVAFSPWRSLTILGSYLAWLVFPPPGLHLEPDPVTGWLALAAVTLVAGVAAGAVWAWRHGWRLEAALAVWCVVTLLPVAQLQPIETTLSERFLYLPSAGAVLLLAALARRVRGRRMRAGTLGAIAALAVTYGAILVPRATTWRHEIALWKAKEAETGGSLKARMNLARALARRGRREEARRYYRAAAELAPDLAAGLEAEMKSLDGADVGTDEYEVSLRKALEQMPNDGALWNNLGFHLYRKGDISGSLQAFERAAQLTPMRATVWLGLALGRMRLGQVVEAGEAARRAATLDPKLEIARGVWAECELRLGRPCEALRIADGVALDAPRERAALDGIRRAARAACPNAAPRETGPVPRR